MAVKTIYEMFDILDANIQGIDYGITAVNKNGVPINVISSDDAKRYMIQKYATRKYPVIMGASATLPDAIRSFYEMYSLYLINHEHGINKQYQALFDYNYSPIENVDRYETETDTGTSSGTNSNTRTLNTTEQTTYGKTETNSGTDSTTYGHTITASGTDRVTDSGTDGLSKTGSITNETQKAGYNAPNTYTPDTKNTESYSNYSESTNYGKQEQTTHGRVDTESGTDSVLHGHTITDSGSDSKSDTGTITDSGSESGSTSNSRDLRVHGNIGVTTNNQLIEAEIEMRKISLAEMILDDIINDYTYYS